RVRVPARAPHAPDRALVQPLDLERAGARAVVRAHRGHHVEAGPGGRHGPRIPDLPPLPPRPVSRARPPCYRFPMAARRPVVLVLACAAALDACTRMESAAGAPPEGPAARALPGPGAAPGGPGRSPAQWRRRPTRLLP